MMQLARGEIGSGPEMDGPLVVLPGRVVRRIVPQQFEEHYAGKYARPLRKLAFFIRREGILETVRKVRSKRLERRLEREQSIVVAAIEPAGTAWGITRDLGGPLRFHRSLLFEGRGETPDGAPLLDAEALAHLESFLPVPACPAPREAALATLACNPGLRPMSAASASQLGSLHSGESVVPAQRQKPRGRAPNTPGVYLVGFGGYVREQVLPWFGRDVRAAADYKAELIARHLRPPFTLLGAAEPMLAEIADDPRPLVIISAYHSDHATLALEALAANPGAYIFIEKPAAVTREEAAALAARRRSGAWIDVGYNRRHAPLLKRLEVEARRAGGPWLLTMSVKELKLPSSHWYRWANQGTRITGNGCHWLDLAVHLIGATPEELTLLSSGDTVVMAIAFADGSLANISLGDAGDDLRGVREWIELRGGSSTIELDDFRRLSHSGPRGTRTRTFRHRDKGHAAMYRGLRRKWQSQEPPAYPVQDLEVVCALTSSASALLLTGEGGRAVGLSHAGADVDQERAGHGSR